MEFIGLTDLQDGETGTEGTIKPQSIHEPDENLMDAADVWEDAQQIASILQHNQSKAEPIVRLQIPLSVFVSALDQFDKDELMIVRQRIDERLAAQQRHRADRDHPQKHQPLH